MLNVVKELQAYKSKLEMEATRIGQALELLTPFESGFSEPIIAPNAPQIVRAYGSAKHKRGPGAAGIERIRAAQKLRWAKYNAKNSAVKPDDVKVNGHRKHKRHLSSSARALISASRKAWWAKKKANV